MRHAEIKCVYEGRDITADIAPGLLRFVYDEVAEGRADTLSISLENKSQNRKWFDAWLPQPGDQIEATLTTYNWAKPGDVQTLRCGKMIVDEPELSGPPDVIHLKALNIPADLGFSDSPKDTTWSSITMKQLGQEIADKYGLQFVYDASDDFVIKALKRSRQTDAALLIETSRKYNLCLKVYNNKLVIFSKHLYEQAAPVITLTRDKSNIENYTLYHSLVGTGFSAATIKYRPIRSKALLEYEYRIVDGGKEMILQEAVDDDAQAEQVAKSRLRAANEKQFTGTFNLALNLNVVAGCTVALEGFGKFDGKWFCDSVRHSYGNQAGTTEIGVHKCLSGDY